MWQSHFLFYILPHLLFTGGLGYYNNTTTFKWPILQILFCINCFVSAFCCIFCFSIKQYLALENLWYILKTFLYVTVLIFNEESLYSKSRAHRSLWVLQIHLTNWAFWPSGKGDYFVCKRSTVQTLLWSPEFVIQINLKHNNIPLRNLARSWSISTDQRSC